MAVVLALLYVVYVLFTVLQLAVLVINDYKENNVSWWTLVYPTVITAAVVAFNWEFSLLVALFEQPAQMAIVWFAFFALVIGTYWAYAYYPQMRRNPFWKSNYGWN